jgi:predicted nucleotidyltransferase
MDLAKLPASYESALQGAQAALQKGLGENLFSLVLYGSAVRGDLEPGTSDLNLLIVLQAPTAQAHAAVREALGQKVRIEPLVVARAGLERTMSVFGLKFLSIRRNYRLLSGEDPFDGFEVPPDLFRFLAEQELRNLLLRTVHAYVTSGVRPQGFGGYLARNASRFVVVLCDTVRTAGVDPKGALADRVPELQQALGTEASVLEDLLALKKRVGKLDPKAAFDLYARLLALLHAAVEWIESRPLAEPT